MLHQWREISVIGRSAIILAGIALSTAFIQTSIYGAPLNYDSLTNTLQSCAMLLAYEGITSRLRDIQEKLDKNNH